MSAGRALANGTLSRLPPFCEAKRCVCAAASPLQPTHKKTSHQARFISTVFQMRFYRALHFGIRQEA